MEYAVSRMKKPHLRDCAIFVFYWLTLFYLWLTLRSQGNTQIWLDTVCRSKFETVPINFKGYFGRKGYPFVFCFVLFCFVLFSFLFFSFLFFFSWKSIFIWDDTSLNVQLILNIAGDNNVKEALDYLHFTIFISRYIYHNTHFIPSCCYKTKI